MSRAKNTELTPVALSEISLEQFMRELRAQVDAFEESWKKNQAVYPEIWCDKIPDGDWLERLCECPGVPGSAAG